MSSLDFEIDSDLNHLRAEWRQAGQITDTLREESTVLSASVAAKPLKLGIAPRRIERIEALMSRIRSKMNQILRPA